MGELKDLDFEIKLLTIFKTYLYLNGKTTARQFCDWLIGKNFGLRKDVSPRMLSMLIKIRPYNGIRKNINVEKKGRAIYYSIKE